MPTDYEILDWLDAMTTQNLPNYPALNLIINLVRESDPVDFDLGSNGCRMIKTIVFGEDWEENYQDSMVPFGKPLSPENIIWRYRDHWVISAIRDLHVPFLTDNEVATVETRHGRIRQFLQASMKSIGCCIGEHGGHVIYVKFKRHPKMNALKAWQAWVHILTQLVKRPDVGLLVECPPGSGKYAPRFDVELCWIGILADESRNVSACLDLGLSHAFLKFILTWQTDDDLCRWIDENPAMWPEATQPAIQLLIRLERSPNMPMDKIPIHLLIPKDLDLRIAGRYYTSPDYLYKRLVARIRRFVDPDLQPVNLHDLHSKGQLLPKLQQLCAQWRARLIDLLSGKADKYIGQLCPGFLNVSTLIMCHVVKLQFGGNLA